MSAKAPKSEPYGEVVSRLKEIVESLEGGELSLEESLERFAEGVKLVKSGEQLRSQAEKKIEQLLADDRVAPLEVKENGAPPARAEKAPARRPPPAADDDEDVPF